MEKKMSYREAVQQAQARQAQLDAFNWRLGLPTLSAQGVTLRELRASDAQALFAMLTTAEVAEFGAPLPRTLEGFSGFIRKVHDERLAGNSICFAVVPDGYEDAMGFFQVGQLEAGFGSAEWGFALPPFWGTAVFQGAARAVAEFVFGVVGVHRLEARSIAANKRGNAALRKMGTMQETQDDWRQVKMVWGPEFH
jgi:RimJ/RimL family protein N-acetyltransferase